MDHNTIEVAADDYERFVNAARAAAVPELENLVRAVITALRAMDAVGLFGDVAARHLWDEYCWQLQEGPYDDDDTGFGSTRRNFDEVLSTTINSTLDALPKHTLLFLSIHTRDGMADADDPDGIGSISRDDIAATVLAGVDEIASRRNLDFIGPSRSDVIPMEISLCSSPEYNEAVRQIDQALKVTNATLVKVPFDLERWQQVAAERYPNGLPKPYSDDPTQWIFHGHPCASVVWDEEAKWTAPGPQRLDASVLQVTGTPERTSSSARRAARTLRLRRSGR